ncbi:MAG: hypothetical protein DMF80_15100 [Acidobacteria bacterium]|nr:MAG: hypothetical protein DMF80_15100 [Acidobacteriota bacterium]
MSQLRKPTRMAAFAAAAVLVGGQATAWGPVAHQAVNSHAIDTLPKGLKPFYKNHRLELPSLSPEAVIPEEGLDRRFAVDRLVPFPFADAPHTEAEMKAHYAEIGEKVGRLPWLIEQSYERLVEAFKARDKNRILAESDQLAGLVADLHNPLALTDNADGQKTGQHGLWARFTIRLPEAMQNRLKLDPDAAHYLDDPRSYLFAMINDTYVWLDNLLYQEDLAHRGQGGYTELYYEMFEQRAGRILRDRLSQAAGDVGSYWYTAWTAAGRPELP